MKQIKYTVMLQRIFPKFRISAKFIHSSKLRIQARIIVERVLCSKSCFKHNIRRKISVLEVWLMNEWRGKGQLEGQEENENPIPQSYPDLAVDGREVRGLRVVRLGGSLNFQPDTGDQASCNLSFPEATGQLFPPTQRPHFRANGLYHEVCWPPDNPTMEARAPCTNFLHACFGANLNLKRARRKGTEKALKKSKEGTKSSHKVFTHIFSTPFTYSPNV